jgi:hypothetical protein
MMMIVMTTKQMRRRRLGVPMPSRKANPLLRRICDIIQSNAKTGKFPGISS